MVGVAQARAVQRKGRVGDQDERGEQRVVEELQQVRPQVRMQRLAEHPELDSPPEGLHQVRGCGRDRGEQD
jgi:hypothetical protein